MENLVSRAGEIGGLVDDKTLDGVKPAVGGSERGETKAAGDGEVERIAGEEAELALELQRHMEVVGQNTSNLQAAGQKIANLRLITFELADEGRLFPHRTGWVGANKAQGLRLLDHASVAEFGRY